MVNRLNTINDFNSLLNYYIACLEKEDKLSLTFNYRLEGKKFYSRFFKKEELFLQKKEQIQIKKSTEMENFLKNYNLSQKNTPVFYGYPLFMDSNGKVSPIFFIEMLVEEKEKEVILTKESIKIDFNHFILTKSNLNVEEIDKIRSELDEEEDFSIKLEKIISLLDLDKKSLSTELDKGPLIVRQNNQLINKAILYSGGRSGFTKGLLKELEEMKKLSLSELESTSLSALFDKNKQHPELTKDVLEIFNLNNSQERAIKTTFCNNLSVITGPPGTGKSQVVLNLIANAVWNDKSILFASKNNKAVEVVNDKLKSILSEELVVRMGSSGFRRKAKEKIDRLFLKRKSLKLSSNIGNDQRKIKSINQGINNLNKQLKIISKLNEDLENSQNQSDCLAQDLPEKLYNSCKCDSFEKIDKFKLETDLKNHFEIFGLIKKIINLFLPSIYTKKQQTIFKYHYDLISNGFRDYLDKNIKLNTEEIKKSLNWVLLFKRIKIIQKETDELKNRLIKSDSIYNLNSKIEKLKSERIKISQKLFENYWFKKLKATSTIDENHISRYFDASDKLRGYIEDYSLWKQLVSDRENEIPAILSFLPVWVVTNLSAKGSLPLKNNLFDLLVIDEASQCDIASALPLFYRAKQVVIIGDPKQLKHISILRDHEDKKLASENNISKIYLDYAYNKNSLYDLTERIIKDKNKKPVLLNQHYRSCKDIINFSNEHFYEKKLDIKTDENNLISNKNYPNGINWIDVKGKTIQTKSPYNKEEAKEVIKTLKKLQKSNKQSIGVVTIFRAQMELIADMIEKIPELKKLKITVGTTHKFQGDEKDIIIFSPAISKGIKQSTLNWVHSTTQLLNVAITRAKSILIIVGDKKKCHGAGRILRSLAEYTEIEKNPEINFDSPIEERLFRRLVKEGIKVIPQWETKIQGKKLYRLDFAFFVNDNQYDIEVDGDKAHSQKVESDSLRDIHLRMERWKIRRFSANEINNNLDNVIKEIKRFN
jgi:superfamily I DNA and/or RNA helicase/very-short-patch-repair endonuclease